MSPSIRRALKRASAVAISLAVFYMVASPFMVPMAVQRFVGSVSEDFSVQTDWMLFHPLTFNLLVKGLVLTDPNGNVLAELPAASLSLDVDDLIAGRGVLASRALDVNWYTEGDQLTFELDNLSPTVFATFGKSQGITFDAGVIRAKFYIPFADGPVTGEAYVSGLRLRGASKPFTFELESMEVDRFAYEPSTHMLKLGSVQLISPALTTVPFPIFDLPSIFPSGSKKGPELQVEIDAVDVLDGSVNILGGGQDAQQQKIAALNIGLRDLRYGADWSGTIDTAGSINNTSPFSVALEVDSAQSASGKIKLVVDRIDHTLLAGSFSRLLGRTAETGTLYADLEAQTSNGQLEGVLSLVFDQWHWGASNPEFTGEQIPLRKAFNLLRGRGGRVRMDLPLEGNLEEPNFKVDAVVRRATNRAIGDIVGAPFKLLGSLIPGGAKSDLELDKIEFEPGSAKLTPLDRSKLSALAVALLERPALQLSIKGSASAEEDFRLAPVSGDDIDALAQARSDAVRTYLIVAGIDEARLSITKRNAGSKDGNAKPVVRLDIIS